MILGGKPCGKCFHCGGSLGKRDAQALLCWSCVAISKAHRVDCTTAVSRAVKSGQLADPATLQGSDCEKPARWYDHRDYSKPLDVEPVCAGCNRRRGPGLLPGTPLFDSLSNAA